MIFSKFICLIGLFVFYLTIFNVGTLRKLQVVNKLFR